MVSIDQLRWKATDRLVGCLLCFTVAIFLVIAPRVCVGDAWLLQQGIQLNNGYDDNVRLRRDLKDSASLTTLAVEAGARRLTESSQYGFRYRGDFTKYSDSDRDDLDDTDFQTFDALAKINSNELNVFTLRAGVSRTFTDRAQNTDVQIDEVDEGEIDTDVGITRLQVKKEALIARTNWVHSISDVSSMEFDYSYFEANYGRGDEIVDLFDYKYHKSALQFGLYWSEKNELFMSVDGGYYETTETNQTNKILGIAFWNSYRLSEISNIGLHIGWRNLEIKDEDLFSNDRGAVFKLYSSKRTELMSLTGSIERRLSPSATGRFLQNDVFELNIDRDISEKISLKMSARYFHNESINMLATNRSDREYAMLEPVLRYFIERGFGIEYAYRFRWQKREDEQESAESHAVMFSVFYEFVGGY